MIDIEKILETLVNKIARKEDFNFRPKNYMMREIYDAEKLMVGKLEYISREFVPGRPMEKKSSQNYIFEPIIIDGIVKYQEVFTGFIAGDSKEVYFNLPYVVDMEQLTELSVDYKQTKIPKLGMLLVLNDVNSPPIKHDDKTILSKRKSK